MFNALVWSFDFDLHDMSNEVSAVDWRIEMCSIVNQSTARKSDQSEVAISGRLSNQKPGKRTNQKAGYKKKQSTFDYLQTLLHTRFLVESVLLIYLGFLFCGVPNVDSVS
jgi:hypothetical protein